MVTGATFRGSRYFPSPDRLDMLQDALFTASREHGWQLLAWAMLANHYHFVAASPREPGTLRHLLGGLHMTTARRVNELDGMPGRKVWFQYWDSRITFHTSFLARLNYVHHNPVKHGVVRDAEEYPWCSAGWFLQTAPGSFVKTVRSFKTDQIRVPEGFGSEAEG